jgi:hypothetical protein
MKSSRNWLLLANKCIELQKNSSYEYIRICFFKSKHKQLSYTFNAMQPNTSNLKNVKNLSTHEFMNIQTIES